MVLSAKEIIELLKREERITIYFEEELDGAPVISKRRRSKFQTVPDPEFGPGTVMGTAAITIYPPYVDGVTTEVSLENDLNTLLDIMAQAYSKTITGLFTMVLK